MAEDKRTQERRLARRAPLALQVELNRNDEERVVYHARDLSTTGVFLVTQNPLDIGDEIDLSVEISGAEQLKVHGVVVRTQQLQPVYEGHNYSGMAIRFSKLDSGVQARLQGLVDAVCDALDPS